MEGDRAGALLADGVDEFDGLIVAETDERIADAGVARGAGPDVKFARDGQRLEAGAAEGAELQFVPATRGETETARAAVDFHAVGAAPALVHAAGELRAFEDAGRAVGEFGEDGDPIIGVVRRVAAHRREVFQTRDETFHRADKMEREVNAVTEHVADFAGAGETFLLPPADVARAPILQAAGAVVIRLAEVAALDEVMEVTHRGHEAIRERGHVAHAGLLGGVGHRLGLGIIHRDGFFAEDVFASGDGGVRDGAVNEVGRGDDDGVDIVARDDFLVARGGGGDAGLLAGAREGVRVGVAEGGDFGFGAEGESGQMILQRDSAAADNGNSECFHKKFRASMGSGWGMTSVAGRGKKSSKFKDSKLKGNSKHQWVRGVIKSG